MAGAAAAAAAMAAAAIDTVGVVEARRSPDWAVIGTPRTRPAAAPVRREVATVPARMTLRIQSSFRSTALGSGALWSHLRRRPVTGLPTGGPEGVRVQFACFFEGSRQKSATFPVWNTVFVADFLASGG